MIITYESRKKSQFLGFFRLETRADVRSTGVGDYASQFLGFFRLETV